MIGVLMIMITKEIMPKHPNILRLPYQDLVVVLEGTNCADILDNALVCSVRFDRQIQIYTLFLLMTLKMSLIV